jgi:molecular chaperone GrpE
MTDTTARGPKDAGLEQPATGTNEADAVTGESPAATAETAEVLTAQVAELRDRWMRALADMENLRRRTEREVADARVYGIAGFARDMVAVADNVRRGLDAVPADLRANADAGLKALLEGIELTERELLKGFEKHNIKKLEPLGAKFDPNLHQAMYEVPDSSVAAGTVVQVVQAGYTIGDRILRPALVGVSKGGPKPSAGANGGVSDAAAESAANDNENS